MLQIFHVEAQFAYRKYDIIISALNEDSAKNSVDEYMQNYTGYTPKYRYSVVYLGDTESEIFHEIQS